MEPLLELVSLRWLRAFRHSNGELFVNRERGDTNHLDGLRALSLVIVGGESGRKARPFDLTWARFLRDECGEARVPFFFKQKGARSFDSKTEPMGQFESFNEWTNKARSWLGGVSGGGIRYKKAEKVVCVDVKGRVCEIGRDFMAARDENAFPVQFFQELRTQGKGGEWPSIPADLQLRQMPGAA